MKLRLDAENLISSYLTVPPTVMLIKGYLNCLITDIQRNKYYIISKELYSFIKIFNNKKLIYIRNKIGSDELLLKILNPLFDDDLVLFVDDPKQFYKINTIGLQNDQTLDCIIEYSEITKYILYEFTSFNHLRIKYLELRVFKGDRNNWISLLESLDQICNSELIGIDIHIEDSNKLFEVFEVQLKEHYRINNIYLYNRTQPNITSGLKFDLYSNAQSLTNKLCGNFNKKLFQVNPEFNLISRTANSCLNQKISIDAEGNIKNCPSMPESFGNIKDTTLAEAIEKPSFKKYWNITKDQIAVCKDCEFRYICTDCRAYKEDPEDDYSKPLKCGYDPYTGVWSEWSKNPLKQKAIQYYGMEEIIKQ